MADKKKPNSTDCVHAAQGPIDVSNAIITPIVNCAPFAFENTKVLLEFLDGRGERTQAEYGRMGNPTVIAVERKLAALEGSEQALLFASGMATVTTIFLHYLQSGDHLTITNDSYKRTRSFCQTFLTKFQIEVSVVEPNMEAIEAALRPETKLIFTESPSNPYLYVVDVEELAKLGKEKGILTVVDSTFATPLNFRPLDYGIDLVIHSATKYLGGHNDLIAGVLMGSAEQVQPVWEFLMTLGGVCDPNTAFLLDRGLKTLALRVARHNSNATAVAEYLERHPKINKVYYPSLPSHPHHEIATRLMSGFGGVVSFLIDADFDGTNRFIDALRIPQIAPSLGGAEALVEQVIAIGYWCATPEEREAAGVKDNLVRLSLGLEEPEDLIADLEQALASF